MPRVNKGERRVVTVRVPVSEMADLEQFLADTDFESRGEFFLEAGRYYRKHAAKERTRKAHPMFDLKTA